jgi:formylglycine-generating enzyme required for sulfatase activity
MRVFLFCAVCAVLCGCERLADDGRTTTSGEYLVIDLSGGTGASSYPVTYLSAVPSGGWTDTYKTTKLVLRKIPKGMFTMGGRSTDFPGGSDAGLHQVTLTKDFYIGVFEVTQRQWELVMGNKPSYFNNANCYASRPVEQVNYYDIREDSENSVISNRWPASSQVYAASFMGKLRAKTGISTFDLPTESQWEYACRAGTITALNTGYNLTNTTRDARMDVAGRYRYSGEFINLIPIGDAPVNLEGRHRYGKDFLAGTFIPKASCTTDSGTAKVGSYLSNAWGLYDMHGNVMEWCLDYKGAYPGTVTDPLGKAEGATRVVRGGSWFVPVKYCLAELRWHYPPYFRFISIGFRVARTLP